MYFGHAAVCLCQLWALDSITVAKARFPNVFCHFHVSLPALDKHTVGYCQPHKALKSLCARLKFLRFFFVFFFQALPCGDRTFRVQAQTRCTCLRFDSRLKSRSMRGAGCSCIFILFFSVECSLCWSGARMDSLIQR